jgi:hypothetical protein
MKVKKEEMKELHKKSVVFKKVKERLINPKWEQ